MKVCHPLLLLLSSSSSHVKEGEEGEDEAWVLQSTSTEEDTPVFFLELSTTHQTLLLVLD